MPAVPRYATYDPFARFYRREWGADYHREARGALEALVYTRLAAGDRVLDLCCGTGDLSRALSNRGYKVTGIDGSAEMLRFARERVTAAEFVLADARSFQCPPVYDAAVSTFDSLNHVLTSAELEAVFANVFAALRPGGFFVFDVNMEDSFLSLWHGSSALVEDDDVCITRGSYDAEARLGRADVTMFVQSEGCWERRDITVFERCYSADEIEGGLRSAGFAGVTSHEGWELGMRGDIAIGRTFYSASKS